MNKGPSIEDVGKFSRFFTPTLLRRQFFYYYLLYFLFVGKFGQFFTPSSLKNATVLNGRSLIKIVSSYVNKNMYHGIYFFRHKLVIPSTRQPSARHGKAMELATEAVIVFMHMGKVTFVKSHKCPCLL